MGGRPISSGVSLSLTNTDTDGSTSNLAIYTFSALSLGDTDPNRWIAIAFGGSGNGRTYNTSTLGGNSADYVDSLVGSTVLSGIVLFNDTTNTTADFSIELSSSAQGLACAVYRFLSTASDPRYDTDTEADNSTTINVTDDGGVVVGACSINSSTADFSAGVTEDYGFDAITNEYFRAGHAADLSSETGRTITHNATMGTMTVHSYTPV